MRVLLHLAAVWVARWVTWSARRWAAASGAAIGAGVAGAAGSAMAAGKGSRTKAAIGGGVGAAGGSVIGNSLGGRNGATIGAGLGGAAVVPSALTCPKVTSVTDSESLRESPARCRAFSWLNVFSKNVSNLDIGPMGIPSRFGNCEVQMRLSLSALFRIIHRLRCDGRRRWQRRRRWRFGRCTR